MKYFLFGKLLRYLGRRLDGYKTLIGGSGLILTGVLGLAGHMFPDQDLPKMEIGEALGAVSLGMTALGLGGKAEKIKKAMAPSPQVTLEETVPAAEAMGEIGQRLEEYVGQDR